jgi:RNA polymerase sigma factor (sigma-70 family)
MEQRMSYLNEQTTKGPQVPWLNADGTKKSEDEIKELGKTWSSETWNQYLDSDVGTLRDDELVFVPTITDETLEKSTVLHFLQEGKHYEDLEAALLLSLSQLTKTERFIIKESFWKMTSNKEISEKLNKTQKNVGVLKSRAIKKLGRILSSKQLSSEISYLKEHDLLSSTIYWKRRWIKSDSLAFC